MKSLLLRIYQNLSFQFYFLYPLTIQSYFDNYKRNLKIYIFLYGLLSRIFIMN